MKRIIWAVAVTTALIFPYPALAAQCGPTDHLANHLKTKYKETVRVMGTGNGRIMQLYAAESGTWSVVIVTPNGRSCLVLSGEGYADIPPENTDPDA